MLVTSLQLSVLTFSHMDRWSSQHGAKPTYAGQTWSDVVTIRKPNCKTPFTQEFQSGLPVFFLGGPDRKVHASLECANVNGDVYMCSPKNNVGINGPDKGKPEAMTLISGHHIDLPWVHFGPLSN